MTTGCSSLSDWTKQRIREDEISRYVDGPEGFIPHAEIESRLRGARPPDWPALKGILAKSLAVRDLTPDEVAALIRVDDPDMLAAMRETALHVKKKVYDNRIVTFAPLYLGNYCVNNCAYCGFRSDNADAKRRVLTDAEIRSEVEVLAGKIGHKRLIVVYGEHPRNDVDFILSSIRTIYGVKVSTKHGTGNIRRVNVNAPPFCVEDLRRIREAGLGTYQVFQETYHRPTYERLHPPATIKGRYLWRLSCMHRAMEAGIDDVGIGVLFGLYDWRFEVLALVYHAMELDRRFGIGPHTVSFPRLEPALHTSLDRFAPYRVSDEDFMKIILIIRLAIPYTGMIITARENAAIRRAAVQIGVTQTDASTKIGIGAYSAADPDQAEDKQQFILGDTRSLDEVIREFAQMGLITSFCTAGYRCGRTGKCIMDLLRQGAEGKFCKLNAVLTFQEWLDDFASEETRAAAAPVLESEIAEIEKKMPAAFPEFMNYYRRIQSGERDLYL